ATNRIAGATDPRWVQMYSLAQSLARLNKQAFDVDRQMMQLNGRAGEVSTTGQREAQKLAKSDAATQKASKKARTLEKKLLREETQAAKAKPAASAPLAAFSSYAPFPFDKERERVLGWFAD